MSSLARVPCTIVTGFLGAGKTTLIRHVLENANGRRLAVIVNEFGDVGIDGEILKGCGDDACPEDNIVELANGCICCTVADEFVPALDQILAREPQPSSTSSSRRRASLCRSRWCRPSIGPRSRAASPSTASSPWSTAPRLPKVRSPPISMRSPNSAGPTARSITTIRIEEVFEDQIACADLVVLNKRDLLDAEGMAKAVAAIAGALPRAVKIVMVAEGKVDPAALLGPRRRHRGRHREPQDPSRQ